MTKIRVLLAISVLTFLIAFTGCAGSHSAIGVDSGTSGVGVVMASGPAPATAHKAADIHRADTGAPASADKLIALTFDDGPRPYVLFGGKEHPGPGLADILDQNGVKATFFVVGWRLTPKTWGERRHEENIGVTCLDAAEQLIKRGHELEDHTYSHVEMRSAERKNGAQWVVGDVDKGAQAIKSVTGSQPRYVRPPDWIITSDVRRDLEHEGYRVLTISSENPMAMRDVNSLDYLCAGKAVGCPKPSLVDGVMKQIEQREKKGTYSHILAFHELSTTSAAMPRLIGDLKARGYRFVTLSEYMKAVGSKAQ